MTWGWENQNHEWTRMDHEGGGGELNHEIHEKHEKHEMTLSGKIRTTKCLHFRGAG